MQLLPNPPKTEQSSQPNALKIVEGESTRVQEIALRERVMVFIDGANLFYAANQLSLEIDYTKLLRQLTRGRSLVRAYFYTGVDSTNKKQQNFLVWMRYHGYRVISKELIQHPDGSRKANLEIEMAIDMLNLVNYCDTFILLSGNGNLSYAVNQVAYRGVRIEVVSLPSMLNDNLRDVADRFIDLSSLQSEIQKSVSSTS
jgi:uncharacterized LabA/DUF88 family protein